MNKIVSGIVLCMSAAIASSAMAAPQSQGYHKDRPAPPPAHWNNKDAKHWKNDRPQPDRRFEKRHDNRVNPSRDWRAGDKLPSMFDHKNYRLSDYEARHLPRASKKQQWYKIQGDYVLVNERNNKIVRILN